MFGVVIDERLPNMAFVRVVQLTRPTYEGSEFDLLRKPCVCHVHNGLHIQNKSWLWMPMHHLCRPIDANSNVVHIESKVAYIVAHVATVLPLTRKFFRNFLFNWCLCKNIYRTEIRLQFKWEWWFTINFRVVFEQKNVKRKKWYEVWKQRIWQISKWGYLTTTISFAKRSSSVLSLVSKDFSYIY